MTINSPGSLATLAAMRRASSRVRRLAADRRPGDAARALGRFRRCARGPHGDHGGRERRDCGAHSRLSGWHISFRRRAASARHSTRTRDPQSLRVRSRGRSGPAAVARPRLLERSVSARLWAIRSARLPKRSAGRSRRSRANSCATGCRAGATRRSTPPEPINCAGGVKRY